MLASHHTTARRAGLAAVLAVALGACSSDDERMRELSRDRQEAQGASARGGQQRPDTQAVVALVNDAARLIAAEGEAAFDDLRAPGSRWRHGETYVFVVEPDGTMRVHLDPALEGKNLIDLRDATGKLFVHEYLSVALRDGAGWTEYVWRKPGSERPARKRTYVKRVEVGGSTYVVGSGVYLE